MRIRSWVWNTSRSVRNYSKKIIHRNVEAELNNSPDVLAQENTYSDDSRELDDVFLKLARMRIQPQVDTATKKVHTLLGDLPLSPLMNPEYLAARRKYAEPKAKVDYSKHGKLEKQLARNPYARALAGSMREDAITKTVLPRFFLQDFAYVPHPETEAPWMVPVSLMSESDKETEAQEIAHGHGSPAVKSASLTEGSSWLNGFDTDQPDDAFTSSPSQHHDHGSGHNLSAVRKGRPRGLPRPASQTSYTLCRREVLKQLLTNIPRGRSKSRVVVRMAARAQAENPNTVVYRADMDTYVLELMRERTMEQLMHYAHICDAPVKPKRYIVRCEGHWDQVQTQAQMQTHRGCVLWMGDCDDKEVKRPGEFETVTLQGVKLHGVLPVHDLTVLLGPENVKRLRVGSIMFSEGSTFLLGGQPSTRLQMKLWKLQGYLASYRENP
ncbi:hypothetical protein MCOR25_001180 [Pyricularia grisea]|nr:hypothetical protein MCOR25_001180 [Pyricularia grisea]